MVANGDEVEVSNGAVIILAVPIFRERERELRMHSSLYQWYLGNEEEEALWWIKGWERSAGAGSGRLDWRLFGPRMVLSF